MPELHDRIGRLEAQVEALMRDLDELEREVRGNGNRNSIRQRLHRLENTRLAAGSARRALSEAVKARESADEARRLGRERKWSRRQTIIATLVGALTLGPSLVLPWVNLYLSLR